MFFGLPLWLSCMKYAPVTPGYQVPDVQYGIRVQGDFTTSDEPAGQQNESYSLTMDWVIDLKALEMQRDDSFWMRLQVMQASYFLDDRAIENAAEGKVIDLRIFPWGELLSVRYIDHLSGDGRWLDVFEPILPTLFPNPPRLSKNESGVKEQRWPIVEGTVTVTRAANRVVWKRLPDENDLLVYAYEGKWLPEARGTLNFHEGRVQGQVWLNPENRWMERHNWTWSRQIENSKALQTQDFEGEMWRISD